MITNSYPAKSRPRLLNEIFDEVADDWDVDDLSVEAEDVIASLRLVERLDEPVGDNKQAIDLVREFLRLSRGWQTETAKRIKYELRRKLGLA